MKECLRKAFDLRRNGKYPEALAQLELACDEDGLAWYVKGEAYYEGGWGLYHNSDNARKCFKKSSELRCEYGIISYLQIEGFGIDGMDTDDPFSKYLCNYNQKHALLACQRGNILAYSYCDDWVEKGCELNCPHGLCEMGEKTKNIQYFYRGAKQKHKECMYHLRNAYLYGNFNTKINIRKAAKLSVELKDFKVIWRRLDHVDLSPEEEFIYGQAFNDPVIFAEFNTLCESPYHCLGVYHACTNAARWTVLCFLSLTTILSKDTRGIIARMVWKSRKNETSVWL